MYLILDNVKRKTLVEICVLLEAFWLLGFTLLGPGVSGVIKLWAGVLFGGGGHQMLASAGLFSGPIQFSREFSSFAWEMNGWPPGTQSYRGRGTGVGWELGEGLGQKSAQSLRLSCTLFGKLHALLCGVEEGNWSFAHFLGISKQLLRFQPHASTVPGSPISEPFWFPGSHVDLFRHPTPIPHYVLL